LITFIYLFTYKIICALFDFLFGVILYKPIYHKLSYLSKYTSNFPYDNPPKVAIAVLVCNDFCAEQIYQSIQQTYKNFSVYILDDSTNKQMVEDINNFAKKNNITIIRRKNNIINGEKYEFGLCAALSDFV
jgi:hypothetical protein